jgi:ABC-type sugar transport system ATPase subunit
MIDINNLTYNINGNRVLDNINLSIPKGGILGLVGKSGSGKTTLLKCIAGHNKPNYGQILINQISLDERNPYNQEIITVWQDRALFPHMTVKQNIMLGLKIKLKKEPNTVNIFNEIVQLLDLVNLLNRYPYQLSGGEKQRVALGRAIVLSPKILLLDEPFTGIDKQSKLSIRVYLKKIIKRFESTFIIVSHDIDELKFIANYYAVLENQTLVQTGTFSELYNSPKSIFVATLFDSPNIIKSDQFEKYTRTHIENSTKKVKNSTDNVKFFLINRFDNENNINIEYQYGVSGIIIGTKIVNLLVEYILKLDNNEYVKIAIAENKSSLKLGKKHTFYWSKKNMIKIK